MKKLTTLLVTVAVLLPASWAFARCYSDADCSPFEKCAPWGQCVSEPAFLARGAANAFLASQASVRASRSEACFANESWGGGCLTDGDCAQEETCDRTSGSCVPNYG